MLGLDRLEPLGDVGRLIDGVAVQQRGGIAFHHQHVAVLGAHEGFLDGVVDKLHQRIVVAGDIEQAAGFAVHAELGPGPDLEEFLERAGAAWQRDEAVGLFHHHGLALVHVLHQVQFGQAAMGLFLFLQQFRDHADHAAAAGQHLVGDDAHDANDRAAIDQAEVALDQFTGQHAGLFQVFGARAGIGAAINADVLQGHMKLLIVGPVTDCVTDRPGSR